MKKSFIFILSLSLSLVLLGGCQQQNQGEEKPNKITVKQVNPDGSKKVVMELGGEKNDKNSQKSTGKENPSVLKGVKGMVIEADGLKPAELPSIKKGTRLMIQNMDAKEHWLMAKEGQKNCSDFNSGKALKSRETYEYTFNTTGECLLYDSMNPDDEKFQAKIVVTE